MMMPRRLRTEQLGKASSKIETDRKLETKKRRKRKTGKRKTRWKCNGLRMRSWRKVWNEDGRKPFAGGRHAKGTRVGST